ncbi:MAG: translocation/assembly module TamB domain-containing protein [Lautropia sp.]
MATRGDPPPGSADFDADTRADTRAGADAGLDARAAAGPVAAKPPARRRRGLAGRVLRALALLLLVVLLAVASGLWWLGSDSGTRFIVERLQRTLADSGMTLRLDGVAGSLWRGLRVERFAWDGSGVAADGEQLVARWSLPALLQRLVLVPELSVARLAVRLPPPSTEPAPPPAPTAMPGSLALPVTFDLQRLAVGELSVTPGVAAGEPPAAPIVVNAIAARLGYGQGRYRIDELTATTQWGRLANGTVEFGDAEPHSLRLRADLQGEVERLGYALALQADGDLAQAAAKLAGRVADAGLDLESQLAPLAVMPLRSARLQLTGLDLRNLQPALDGRASAGGATAAGAIAAPSATPPPGTSATPPGISVAPPGASASPPGAPPAPPAAPSAPPAAPSGTPPATPLPRTRIDVDATVTPRPAPTPDALPTAWDATLSLRNGDSGRYAEGRLPLAALASRVEWQQPADPADSRLRLDGLKLTLPGPRGGAGKPAADATIAGSVDVQPNRSISLAGTAVPETVAKLVFDAIDITAFAPKSLDGQWPATALGGELTIERNVFALALSQSAERMRALLPASAAAAVGAAAVIARGRVDENVLRLDEAQVRLGPSSVTAKGRTGLTEPYRLQFSGDFKRIDLAQWLPRDLTPEPRWREGNLSGDWSVDGSVLPGFDGALTLKLADSTYAGDPLTADIRSRAMLDAQWAPKRLAQTSVDVRLGANRVRANGALGQPADKLTLDVDLPAPQRFEPRLTGRATLNGDVTGAFDRLRGRFALRGERIRFVQPDGDVRLGSVRIDANAPLAARPPPQAALALALQLRNATAAGRTLASADLKVDGSTQSHRFDLAAEGEGQKLRLNGDGRAQLDGAPSWRARLATLAIDGAVPLQLAAPADLRVDAESLRLDRFGVALAGGEIRLERADVGWAGTPTFAARGGARDLAIPGLMALAGVDPKSDPAYDALRALRLGADWDLKGSGIEDLSGTARVDLREAAPASGAAAPGASMSGASPSGASASGASVPGAKTTAPAAAGSGPLGLSGDNGIQLRLAQGRVDGRFDLALPSLAFTHPLTAPDLVLDGSLRLAGKVAGTLARPLWDATVTGERLAVLQRSVGWRLTDGALDARLAGRSVDLQTFKFQSGDGSVELRGRANLLEAPRPARAGKVDPNSASTLPLDGRFELTATRFQVPIGPGQRVALSGRTELASGADGLGLRGQLRVDNGIIEIQGSSAPAMPADVKIVDPRAGGSTAARTPDGKEEKAPPSAIRIATDLAVELGERLRVTGNGLAARLTGNLRVLGLLPEQPRLTGLITIVDGSYQAYGQNLRIDKGMVRFNGPVDNPSLDITAKRPFLPVEVGIAITGTALAPKIALFSTPEMSETDRLTWLVLGTDPSQAPNAAQTLVLRQAATSLLTDDDGSYKPGVAERLGLDVFNFGYGSDTGPAQGVKESMSPTGLPGANTATASAAQQEVVTLGKRIGSRLFVSYEQGVRGIWNLLRIQYTLTRRLSVRAQSGSDNAVDLMYSYSFD